MMSDILEQLAQARPVQLDLAAPGWDERREQLLVELDDRAAHSPQPEGDSTTRRRRVLLVAAAAAAVALVVIVGAAIQTGQRVQPDPAQTVTAVTVDPNRPVHPVGAGDYFLRRSTTTGSLGYGVQTVQGAVWFDDQGTMWSIHTSSDGEVESLGPLAASDKANPLSFLNSLSDDPALAAQQLAKGSERASDTLQDAAQANLTPNQYRVLREAALRQKGAKSLGDAVDTLSRPATVVQLPGNSNSVARFYFAKPSDEIVEVRVVLRGKDGSEFEVGRVVMLGEVRKSVPVPPFEPVVPTATVPATQQMNRDVPAGQFLRRSVTVSLAGRNQRTDGTQWVDAEQRRWLSVGGTLTGPEEVPAPAGMTPQQYLAAMPPQIREVDGWFVQGIPESCGECLLQRSDALMLANLNPTQRGLVVAAIARQPGASDMLLTDSLGRPAREMTLEARVGDVTASRTYRYDPSTMELLEWQISDPSLRPNGVISVTFLGSEVTGEAPR